jgi:VWFA-related protein
VRRSQRRAFRAVAEFAVSVAGIGFAVVAALVVLPARAQAQQQASVQAASSTDGVATIRTHTNLVVVDVVVTDSKHNPIHGLKAADFTLLENNKPQHIRNFDEHSATQTGETFVPAPKLPAGLFSNRAPVPSNGPVNVLLLDYLNTPLDAQLYARKQLMEFLSKEPPGTRIAIFALTTKLSMLQGFTTDPAVLKAALTMSKGAPQASQILADPNAGGAAGSTTLTDALNEPTAVGGDITQEIIADITRFQTLESSFEQDMRARYTLSGFQLLARYLEGIPGRKNVIWYSGSFPLNIDPSVNADDAPDGVVRNDDELRTTDNLLTRAQVAVYPVDARGLMTDPSLMGGGSNASISGSSGADAAQASMDFAMRTSQEHETMSAMAEETGGETFFNTNGLAQAVAKSVEDGSNYYTLTYTPTNSEWDGRFRAIKIKVEELPGVKLSYRNGYYADDPNDRSKLVAGHTALAAAAPTTTMTTAMMHGGPDPAEILFKVRIRPAAAPPEATPLKTNRTNPDPKVKLAGPYKEYGVDLVPDARSVSCPVVPATGARRCALEVFTYVYDRDGQLLITANNNIRATLSPADYAKLQTTGMAFHQEVSVPVKGEYYLRTAIHDLVSDRVGAVEVPVAAVAHLDPLKPLPAVAAPAAGSAAGGAGAASGTTAPK